ncbi:MAG: GTP-binding protein, partial [Pseudomonadota bacterium]
VKFAEVVVVLIEPDRSFETQDLRIADLAEREGRAIVFAVNKWDLEGDKNAKIRELREELTRLLPQLKGAPLVQISALTGRGLDKLADAITQAHRIWNTRISTSKLNDWLLAATQSHPPPAPGGRRIKMRYMTQVKARPPSFVVMCQRADDVPDSYTRYLVNGLRADFGLPGTPIRLMLRKGKNPYA